MDQLNSGQGHARGQSQQGFVWGMPNMPWPGGSPGMWQGHPHMPLYNQMGPTSAPLQHAMPQPFLQYPPHGQQHHREQPAMQGSRHNQPYGRGGRGGFSFGRDGRGRGRGRGNPIVAALISTYADPYTKSKYDECDPQVVEGLWGVPEPVGGAAAPGAAAPSTAGTAAAAQTKPSTPEAHPAQGREAHDTDAGGQLQEGVIQEERQQRQHQEGLLQQQRAQEQQQRPGEQQQRQVQHHGRPEQYGEASKSNRKRRKEGVQEHDEVQEEQQQGVQQQQQQHEEQQQRQLAQGEQQQVQQHRTEAELEACRARRSLPILLFDLNGTLTSHTSQRNAAGTNYPRPHVALLARLAKKFRLGIYTSSTVRTVASAKQMLEEAAGCPLFEPHLILYREHTMPAPAAHRENGGKEWDTVKPLGKYFGKMDRVLLFDDDEYKALAGEEGNMVLVPAWGNGVREDQGCRVLEALVAAVEEELGGLCESADVRAVVPRIRHRLLAAAQARKEEEQQQRQQQEQQQQQQQEELPAEAKDPNQIDINDDV